MSDPVVTYELDGDVALVGLNRDEFRNAINAEVLDQLYDHALRANEEARAAVLLLRRPFRRTSSIMTNTRRANERKEPISRPGILFLRVLRALL